MTLQLSGLTGVSKVQDGAVGAAAIASGAVGTDKLAAAAVTPPKLSGGQTGSPPVFGCRAWCVFDGTLTGTNAPLAGGNVTSVTRIAAGEYVVNLTIGMPDLNYAVVPNAGAAANKPDACEDSSVRSTTTFKVLTSAGGGAAAMADPARVSVAVYR